MEEGENKLMKETDIAYLRIFFSLWRKQYERGLGFIYCHSVLMTRGSERACVTAAKKAKSNHCGQQEADQCVNVTQSPLRYAICCQLTPSNNCILNKYITTECFF